MAISSRVLSVMLALLPLTASAANGFGGGVGVGAGAGAGNGGNMPFAGPLIQPFEPWVKTAKVGDFIVMKLKNGRTQKKTVKSIDAAEVVVSIAFSGGAADKTGEQKYSRDEKTAVASREIDMAKTSSSSGKVGSQTVEYDVYDGFIKGLVASVNGQESFKAMKYEKIVAKGVPFGGVIKELEAADDGKTIQFGKGHKAGAIKNTNETLEVMYEVTEFGLGA